MVKSKYALLQAVTIMNKFINTTVILDTKAVISPPKLYLVGKLQKHGQWFKFSRFTSSKNFMIFATFQNNVALQYNMLYYYEN